MANAQNTQKNPKTPYILLLVAMPLCVAAGIWGAPFLTGSKAQATVEMQPTTDYVELGKPIVVNLKGTIPRYLQTNVVVVSTKPAVTTALKNHTAELRNIAMMLLAEQTDESIRPKENRLALQRQLKDQMVELLRKRKQPTEIDSVVFTDLVVQ